MSRITKILLFSLYLFLGLLILYLANSQLDIDQKLEDNKLAIQVMKKASLQDINEVDGQEIYVPAYSNIKSVDGKSDIMLSINLSVRNTDPDHPIFLSYVDFYNTAGKKSKSFLEEPIEIDPMATVNFHVAQSDTTGGIGANFYLKWISDTTVHEPVVEAIMLGSSGTQGFTWSSQGLVVKQAKGD